MASPHLSSLTHALQLIVSSHMYYTAVVQYSTACRLFPRSLIRRYSYRTVGWRKTEPPSAITTVRRSANASSPRSSSTPTSYHLASSPSSPSASSATSRARNRRPSPPASRRSLPARSARPAGCSYWWSWCSPSSGFPSTSTCSTCTSAATCRRTRSIRASAGCGTDWPTSTRASTRSSTTTHRRSFATPSAMWRAAADRARRRTVIFGRFRRPAQRRSSGWYGRRLTLGRWRRRIWTGPPSKPLCCETPVLPTRWPLGSRRELNYRGLLATSDLAVGSHRTANHLVHVALSYLDLWSRAVEAPWKLSTSQRIKT